MKIKAKLEPGNVAVVTGGSSGIGRAIACGLANRGMDIWLVAQRKDILESARLEVETHKQNQSQMIRIIPADVSDIKQVQLVAEKVIEQSGPPNLLINSAGVAHPGYVEELDISIFNWMMEVNYFGTVFITKEFLPVMLKNGSGYIVNISSIAGIISAFGYTAYGASKFAVKGFSDALRQEMKLHQIGVSVVFPSDTDTPQLEYENRIKPPETKALGSMGGSMTAVEVAKETLAGIERGRYMIIPGLEGKILYHANGLLGLGINPIIDYLIADAVKKKNSSHSKEA
jgi:3-dehydrosphinganine reductase